MERKPVIRVLIVDDNARVREGLAALVGYEHDMEVAAEADNGEEAVALFGRRERIRLKGYVLKDAPREQIPGSLHSIIAEAANAAE